MNFNDFYFHTLYKLFTHRPSIAPSKMSRFIRNALSSTQIDDSSKGVFEKFEKFAKNNTSILNKNVDWVQSLFDFGQYIDLQDNISRESNYQFDQAIVNLLNRLPESWTITTIDNHGTGKVVKNNVNEVMLELDVLTSANSFFGYQQRNFDLKVIVEDEASLYDVLKLMALMSLKVEVNKVGEDFRGRLFLLEILMPNHIVNSINLAKKANEEISSKLCRSGRYALFCENCLLGYVRNKNEVKEVMNEDFDSVIRMLPDSDSGSYFGLTTFHAYHWEDLNENQIKMSEIFGKRKFKSLQLEIDRRNEN